MLWYLPGAQAHFFRYAAAFSRISVPLRFAGDVSPAVCDALLLPGGGDVDPARYGQENRFAVGIDAQRDERELALIDDFVRAGKPVFGICRGAQILNVYFGGTLVQHLDGHTQPGERDCAHLVRTDDPLLRGLYGAAFQVNSAHHQAVDRPGRGLLVTQRAPDGTVEGFRHETLPVCAVQWHPERTASAMSACVDGDLLLRAFCRDPFAPKP